MVDKRSTECSMRLTKLICYMIFAQAHWGILPLRESKIYITEVRGSMKAFSSKCKWDSVSWTDLTSTWIVERRTSCGLEERDQQQGVGRGSRDTDRNSSAGRCQRRRWSSSSFWARCSGSPGSLTAMLHLSRCCTLPCRSWRSCRRFVASVKACQFLRLG